jgi:uncharacterized membrane protein YfcA
LIGRSSNHSCSHRCPTALLGGFIVLDEHVYNGVTGIVFLAAAAILAFRRPRIGEPDQSTPLWGAIAIRAGVGLVSGLTGVGGGVFLAPILMAILYFKPTQALEGDDFVNGRLTFGR